MMAPAPALFVARSTLTQEEEPEYVQWLRRLDKEALDRLEACCNALRELEREQRGLMRPRSPSRKPPPEGSMLD